MSAVEGELQRDLALERLQDANDAWIKRAVETIQGVALRLPVFTTDTVWIAMGEDTPPEPRAMGAAMRLAARQKIIEATNRTAKSTRAACHRRPVTVWRSLVF